MLAMNDLSGKRIAIIGAGLAGIASARGLTQRGAVVTLLEKSRGFGGRCASKRWEGHVIDHGAQYFTMRDERFRDAATAACGEALWRLEKPVRDENGRELPDSGRWIHREGNSRLARELAKGIEIRSECQIDDARTLLADFGHVVSTAPWPQTARLFGIEHAFDYIPCLAVALAYHGEWIGCTREAYAFSHPGTALAWTACENHKPGRIAPGFTVLLAHLGEAFSREHLEKPPTEYPALVRSMVEERWEIPAEAFAGAFGHRWRLARVDAPFIAPALPPRLHFVGDALRRSRVEDAWLAGHEFAQTTSFES
jgi:predicted NAD/FAD-dependent oxidoreductase